MQIGILEPAGFSAEAHARLTSLGTVVTFSSSDLAGFLKPLDALFIRLAYRVDANFLSMTPRLRWLCSPTTGHNHIEETALAARGIRLLSLRGERAYLDTIRATPEHTFGLVLALLRRYAGAFSATLAGQWDRDACIGEELYGNTIGIVGLGRVGFRVASYFSAFGAQVVWCDPADVPSLLEWRRLPDPKSVIGASRIVVLCASYSRGQAPVLGVEEIAALDGRYFVNTARGELVNESALFAAVRDDRLAGVALDVVANENGNNRLSDWRQLTGERNLILTPHIGGATVESMGRTEYFIAEKLSKEAEGGGA
jgi:D-3-phosphoglycerate dehydrogenase